MGGGYGLNEYSTDEEDMTSGKSHKGVKRFPSFHNTAPLTYYPQRHIISLYNGSREITRIKLFDDVLDLMETINSQLHRKRNHIPATDDPRNLYYKVLKSCTDTTPTGHDFDQYLLYKALRYCHEEVNIDLVSLEEAHPASNSLRPLLNLSPIQIESIVNNTSMCFDLWKILCKIRNKIQRAHVRGKNEKLDLNKEVLGYHVYAHNEILIFVNKLKGEEEMILINYEQYLMLVDVVSCRLMCRLACQVNDLTVKDELPTQDLLVEVYSWGDELLKTYGLDAYALIGEYETLVTNHFVNFPGFDPLELGLPFTAAILDTASELRDKYGISEEHTRAFARIFSKIKSPNILSELFGLRKHWGNPMVDAVASSLAVQEKIKEDLPIDGSALIQLTASFTRMIVIEYIKRNSKWPDCEFIQGCEDMPLFKSWKSKSLNIIETAEGHLHEHWAMIRFLPNCILDDYYDQVSHLSDKSISYYREHLDFAYVSQLHKACPLEKPEEKRRLLLEFLRKQQMSIMDICATVMRDEIPYSWLCNSACMKGGEMKHICARIFAVFPFELRQYFTITEDMIKEHIFKYNPYQTMTMKEVDLLAKLRGITEQMNFDNSDRELSVIHIIDFSKWNLRMKYENTAGVFKTIDDFMGTPGLIEATHVVFSEMINIVQDAFNPPHDLVENASIPTIWKDHIVGWEGQRQKGWTCVTSAILSNVELRTGVTSTICGQGDNQIMLSKFRVPNDYLNVTDWINRNPQGVKAVLDQFYNILEEECSKIGLKIKTAETCRSLSYLNYGKKLYFNGAELSMSLKRISKMMTEPNDFYPTTEQRLKTQEGSIYAAGLHSHPSILQYFISRVGTYLLLDDAYLDNPLSTDRCKSLFLKRNKLYSHRMLSFIMKIPASLGGPPQQMLPAYFCRGHPDPLCEDLVMVCLRARAGDTVSRKLLRAIKAPGWFRADKEDKTSIIHSPYSLNLNTPPSATKPLQKKVETALRSFCQNDDIKDLFGADVSDQEKSLMASLSTMKPFQPLVANDIFERSLPGRKTAFISGFTNASSFGSLIKENNYEPLITVVERLETEQLDYWVSMWELLEDTIPVDKSVVPAHHILAQRLRNQSWGCHIEGVTVPHPLEMMKMTRCDSDLCGEECSSCEQEHVVITLGSENLIKIPTHNRNNITTIRARGSNPYLGNVITEGLTSKELRCENPNAPFDDAVRLEIVKQWVSAPGSNLEELIEQVQETRTDVPKSILSKAAGRPGRSSYNHRAHLVSVVRACAPCSTSNMFSRMYISSNRMGEYSHGDRNYHLAFGPTYLTFQSLLALNMIGSAKDYKVESNIREVYHLHVREHDIPVVYDGKLEVEVPCDLPKADPPRLLFAYYDKLTFSEPSGAVLRGTWWEPDTATYTESCWMYAQQLFSNSIVNELVSHELMSLESRESYPPRTADISIGDILMVGPDKFCHALAANILLLLPMDVIATHSELVFKTASRDFLDHFSDNFWSSYIVPMTHPRVLGKLVKRNSDITKYISRTYGGTKQFLKEKLTDDICSIWKGLRKTILSETPLCCMLIGAPSFSATKAMLARYLEVCVVILAPLSNLSPEEIFFMARSLVALLHGNSEENFRDNIISCQDSYLNITSNILCGTSKHLPEIKIYSTREVWVDMIRNRSSSKFHDEEGVECKSYSLEENYVIKEEIVMPETSILTSYGLCKCSPSPVIDLYQTYRYYSPMGSLGKTGHHVLEVLMSSNFDLEGVIVLGSKVGMEAAGITLLESNRWVYVNTPSAMTDYAPHAAGISIPPAFWSDGVKEKLISIPSNAMCTNSLLEQGTYQNINTHIREHSPTGIVCMLSNFKDVDIADTLKIGFFLSNFVRVNPSVTWLVLSINLVCEHQVMSVLSLLGCIFKKIKVVYPTFNPWRSKRFCILASVRKAFIEEQAVSLIRIGDANVKILAESWPATILKRVDEHNHAACFQTVYQAMLNKILKMDVFSENIQILRSSYIPGWKPEHSLETLFEEEVKVDLEDIFEMFVNSLHTLISTSQRVRNGLPIVRANILLIEESDIVNGVERIMNRLFRIIVLQKMMRDKCKRMNLHELTARLDKIVNDEYRISIHGATVKLRVDRGSFLKKHSGVLFEMLGRMWRHRRLDAEVTTVRVFHRLTFFVPLVNVENGYFSRVTFSRYLPSPNYTWSWTTRSWILILLAICKIVKPDHLFRCHSHMEYLVNARVTALLGIQNLSLSDIRSPHFNIFWLKDRTEIPPDLRVGDWVVVRSMDFKYLAERYTLVNVYYAPWSGVKPGRVVVEIKRRGAHSDLEGLYPETENVQHLYSSIGRMLIGCSCISCMSEFLICEKTGVSTSTLDDACQARRGETIISRDHRLLPMVDN